MGTRYPPVTHFFLIPDPTRFSFENNWVTVQPKFWQLPDISGIPDFWGKPEISGIPKHEEVYKTFLHIHSIISSLFERFVKFHFNLWNLPEGTQGAKQCKIIRPKAKLNAYPKYPT